MVSILWSDCFLNTTGCQHVAVSFLEVMKAHAFAINWLQVLSGKALLPRRLRLTPWVSEPNHLAVFSVDLSKDSLICLVASIMHRACFSQLLYIQISKQTWKNTGSGSTWANKALILLYNVWLESGKSWQKQRVWQQQMTEAKDLLS